jgi:hypothetical protein
MSRVKPCAAMIVTLAGLGASPAFATPIVITDQMDSAATYRGGDYGGYASANFANRAAGARHWGDELYDSEHRFDTTAITITRDDAHGSITFALHTMFDGEDLGVHYADLFIGTTDPNTPGGYNYAIALGYQTLAAGFYGNISTLTSNDIWGTSNYGYGGYSQLKTTAPGYDPNMALASVTRLTGGAALPYGVSVGRTDAGGGFYDLIVTLTGDLSPFDDFELFWGTGDCGNDTVWGSAATDPPPVTAPPALWLMSLGALMMRQRRPAVRPIARPRLL